MTYHHLSHAGNFADVFKHLILIQWLLALRRQPRAFCYFETHAGAGRYDLCSADAQASGEYLQGIGRLWQNLPPQSSIDSPPGIAAYLKAVQAVNPGMNTGQAVIPRYYPGSPRIAYSLLRDQDRMVLFERDPDIYRQLQSEFTGADRVIPQQADGLSAWLAQFPPDETHGLVLIDPPCIEHHEMDAVTATFRQAHKQWPQGGYAIWYPIKNGFSLEGWPHDLLKDGDSELLRIELTLHAGDTTNTLRGCGLALIHPPAELEEALREMLVRWHGRLVSRVLGEVTFTWVAQ